MKKYFALIAIIAVSSFFFSCKDDSVFIVSGTINNPGSLKKIFLIQQDVTGISVVDSTNLSEDGKFQIKHAAPFANVFRLRVGGSIFDFIAKNGDRIDFSTNLTDTSHIYIIAGSAESEKLREFNKISNTYGAVTNKIVGEYENKVQELGQKAQDSLMKVYQPQFMKSFNEGSLAILKFVDDNKQSLAGVYAASTLDSIRYETQLVNYAESIKNDFKDNPWVQSFIKNKLAIEPVTVGHKAPDFTIGGFDGKPAKLSDYRGKYVMLDFWASWCVPCRHENPNVVKQYAIYKPLGLNILGISLDVDKKNWGKAVQDDKITWPQASDLKNFEGPTERLYMVNQIPSNFIIDPNGVIVAKNIMGSDLEEFLKKTFNKPQ